jgi:V8-like Glu-specific endopeptidase
MKNILLLLVITISAQVAIGQRPLFRKDLGCGPEYNLKNRQDIVGPVAENAPYNGIVHIGKNNGEDWGTGAWISDSVLITARHVALGLRNLELIQYTATGYHDLYFRSSEYQVIYDRTYRRSINHEIALIKFTNRSKIKPLINTIFSLRDYTALWPTIGNDVYLTGYPFDKADANQNRKPFPVDTLSDKHCVKDSLQFSNDHTMVGYPLYTCSGDSGAPLWVRLGNSYYIIGIHFGYSPGWVQNPKYNLSTLLNKQELDWINLQLH